jgi:hypothetical protein
MQALDVLRGRRFDFLVFDLEMLDTHGGGVLKACSLNSEALGMMAPH